MNKRGEGGELLRWNIAFIVIEVAVFAIMFVWIVGFQDGVAVKEDFYAKELTRLINSATPREISSLKVKSVSLDVTDAVKLADEKRVGRSDIFTFNNVQNTVSVKLSRRSGTSFKFFNEVDVIFLGLEKESEFSDVMLLKFDIVETIGGGNE